VSIDELTVCPEASVRSDVRPPRLALLLPVLLAAALVPGPAAAGPPAVGQDSAHGAVVLAASAPTLPTASGRTAVVPGAGRTATLTTGSGRTAAVLAQLDRFAIPGTAWGVDPATDQVVVSADDTVTGADLATVTAIVSGAGPAARLERIPGELRRMISGGDAIYPGYARCSLGFNAHNATNWYFITAGHCVSSVGTTVYADAAHTVVLGTVTSISYPAGDYAIVRYTNSAISHPSSVNLYPGSQSIGSVGTALVGQVVRRSGATTGVRTGTVTAVNVTIAFPEGTITGLIRTNICAEGGDSGGPLFSNTVALGILISGSGNCTTGGTTYYRPVREVFAAYGLTVP
jgi:streptogrisin D